MSGDHRPSALFVSPVVPALTGNGLSMRAGATLVALSRHFRISLLIVQRYFSVWGDQLPHEMQAYCDEVAIRRESDARISSVAFTNAPFERIHVFRRGTLPYAQPYIEDTARAEVHLDLDDVESVSFRRIAERCQVRGWHDEARRYAMLAAEAARAENDELRRFDRVYVCSAEDVTKLPVAIQPRAMVLPNVITDSISLPPPPPEVGNVLFVGTLGYLPNADGVHWFATDVWPLIRDSSPVPGRLNVVGVGMSPLVMALQGIDGIDLIGFVPDLQPWYDSSQILVVPLFAGGGTRIKILEAFAFGRPVVSTSLGAEGLSVEAGRELLIADDATTFADACLQLLSDRRLRDRLIANASSFVATHHGPDVLISTLAPTSAPAFRPRRES